MARVPVILRDPVEDAYLVDAAIAPADAQAAVEALTHTAGDGLYPYRGVYVVFLAPGIARRFHRFAFERDAYAWLVGVKP